MILNMKEEIFVV